MNEVQMIEKEIPQEVITEAMAAFQQGLSLLKPFMLAITTNDGRKLFKMSDGSEPFVGKTVDFSQTNPEFIPGFMNVESLTIGLAVYQQIVPFCNLFSELATLAGDTRMVAGAQAMAEALKYYNSTQIASENRVPGAKPIADELKKRFAHKKRKADAVENGAKVRSLAG